MYFIPYHGYYYEENSISGIQFSFKFIYLFYFWNISLDDSSVTEWEHLPPIGPRPHKGFVGLKNAGATCYMNSVIQQVCLSHVVRLECLFE